MAALTAARLKTFQYSTGPVPEVISIKVKGSTKCIQGGIAVIDAGYAKPGVTAAGLVAVGVFMETVDNTSGSDGDKRVKVKQGVFSLNNATAGDACAQAEVGTDVYVLDDQTITKTSTGRSKAGKLIDIDANGQLYVQIGLGVV